MMSFKYIYLNVVLALLAFLSDKHAEAQEIELARGHWYNSVGATPFDPTDQIELSDFCTGTETDSTDCVLNWVQAGREEPDRHLFASAGIYTLRSSIKVYSGMHIRCESPHKTIFRLREVNSGPHISSRFYDPPHPPDHVSDVLIENCGFDMNGDPGNFAGAFTLQSADRVTYRNNRVFDSTGIRCSKSNCQRQYVVVLKAQDTLIENNHLSEGGRIKLGRPGRRMVIRNNVLDFVNDNGITVVGVSGSEWPDGTNVSEDILIDGNKVVDAIGAGIFFGSDGEPYGRGVTTRRVTIINNTILGQTNHCISGMLPDHATEIFIGNNRCAQRSPGKFATGIGLLRANDASGKAEKITLRRNVVAHTTSTTLEVGAYPVKPTVEACLLDNAAHNSTFAAWFFDDSTVHLNGNDWGGGAVRIELGARVVELNRAGREKCFAPTFVRRRPSRPTRAPRN